VRHARLAFAVFRAVDRGVAERPAWNPPDNAYLKPWVTLEIHLMLIVMTAGAIGCGNTAMPR
jgi:hypothetical protein